MSTQRGATLIEAVVAMLATGFVLLGLSSAYMGMARTFSESSSQAALQRQGTLALAEIGQRVRSGFGAGGPAVTTVSCRGHANSIQVAVPVTAGFPSGTVCYYAGSSGQLWQAATTAGGECTDTTCWNLLSEKLGPRPAASPGWTGISLYTQGAMPGVDSGRCVDTAGNPLADGARCFRTANSTTGVTVAFAITDGLNVMPFSITLSCTGRNC